MTFREEYKKSNDSVHAPSNIIERIKNNASIETSEESFTLFEEKPRRRWVSIATYSGVAVAAAALVLLIFNPFRSAKAAAPAMLAADQAYNETASLAEAKSAEVSMESMSVMAAGDAAPVAEDILFDSAKANSMEDNEEDLYFAAAEEMTYEDIFSVLSPATRKNSGSSASAPILLTKESGAIFSENRVIIGENYVELPENRTLRALADLSGKILAVSESNDTVYVTSIEQINGKLAVKEEAFQSGTFLNCSLRDSTVFEGESLATYPVFEIITVYTADITTAAGDDPSTFCPVISDPFGTRPLDPSEISVYEEGSIFTVYAGYECSDSLRILYTFAELGLE